MSDKPRSGSILDSKDPPSPIRINRRIASFALARLPENALKYVVGVMMTAFGLFWFGEGIGIEWPYADAAILGLIAVLFVGSTISVRLSRWVRSAQA